MNFFYKRLVDFLSSNLRTDANYFMKGGFWLSVAQIVTVVGGLTVSIMFIRILSPTDYGVYRYLIGIAGILTVFSLSGLDQSIIQATARKYFRYYSETIRINFIYNFGIILAATGGAIYYFYNNNYTLSLGCLIIALLQPLVNTFQNVPAFLQGCHKFKESTIAKSIKTGVVSLLTIGAILITQDIVVLFLTYLLSILATNIFTHFYFTRSSGEPTPPHIFRKYILFAKNSSARNFIVGLANQLDTVIIFTQLGATDLATYAVANLIPKQISGSLKNLATLLVPKYAKHADIATIRIGIPRKSILFFGIILFGSLLYIAMAPHIFLLLFPKYESAIRLSQLAALSLPALTAMIPMSALQSQLKERELYYFSFQSSATLIFFSVSLTLAFGLTGAVVAKILSRYANLLLAYYHLSRCK